MRGTVRFGSMVWVALFGAFGCAVEVDDVRSARVELWERELPVRGGGGGGGGAGGGGGCGSAPRWYRDADADGYGDSADMVRACTQPSGYVELHPLVDCDDTNAAVHPGARELCDGIDNDCDGTAADDDWWDPAMPYRLPIAFTPDIGGGGPVGAASGIAVEVDVDFASAMTALGRPQSALDLASIRVADCGLGQIPSHFAEDLAGAFGGAVADPTGDRRGTLFFSYPSAVSHGTAVQLHVYFAELGDVVPAPAAPTAPLTTVPVGSYTQIRMGSFDMRAQIDSARGGLLTLFQQGFGGSSSGTQDTPLGNAIYVNGNPYHYWIQGLPGEVPATVDVLASSANVAVVRSSGQRDYSADPYGILGGGYEYEYTYTVLASSVAPTVYIDAWARTDRDTAFRQSAFNDPIKGLGDWRDGLRPFQFAPGFPVTNTLRQQHYLDVTDGARGLTVNVFQGGTQASALGWLDYIGHISVWGSDVMPVTGTHPNGFAYHQWPASSVVFAHQRMAISMHYGTGPVVLAAPARVSAGAVEQL